MAAVKVFRTPILIGAGAVVIALVVLVALVVPEGHKLSALNSQKQTLLLQEQTLQAEIVTLQHDQNQKVTNCGTFGTLQQEIPAALDESQFVLDVGQLAQQSGAPSIPSLTWGASTPGAAVDSVAVTLTLQGSFGQVMTFVKGLDGSAFHRLFTISTFTVSAAGSPGSSGSGSGAATPVVIGTSLQSPSAGGYAVSLQGSIYYAPSVHGDPCAAVKGTASKPTAA